MVSSFPLKKNTATKIVFPILDADGDLVGGATALDSEYSLDGGVFTDCTNEATDITSAAVNTGIYYLNLLAGETNGDVVCIQVKTSTAGAKTTVLVFYTATQTLDETDAIVDLIKTETDSHPTLTEIEASTVIAKEATFTHATYGIDKIKTETAAIKAKTDSLTFTTGNVHSHIKVTDDIDLSATQKASVNTEVDNALNTAIPAVNTADSINDILLDTLGTDVWATATRALTDKAGFTISGTKTTLDALNDVTAASVWAVATRAHV